jgi:two-component system sensor histidine kinase HydH
MEGLISRLLNYARPDECDTQYADVNAVIDNAVELAALKANQSQITIEKHYDHGIPGLFIDEKRLSQAILNLLLNAVDAIDGSGTISVTTALDAETRKVRIVIRDSGKGIPGELQEKIFDPFFTTRAGGTGLGLAIVQQIIFEHNGTIAVESAAEGGTAFTIMLPVSHRAPAPAGAGAGQILT